MNHRLKRRRQLLSGILTGILVLLHPAGLEKLLAMEEPTYDGKALSRWLKDLDVENTIETQQKARPALIAIGTNAIPYLLSEVRTWPNQRDDKQKWRIFSAFQILGDSASNAIPALESMLADSRDTTNVVGLIAQIGPKANDTLLHLVTNKNSQVRFTVVMHLEAAGAGRSDSVQALIGRLSDTSGEVRSAAANRLGNADLYSEQVISALISSLSDSDPDVRVTAALSLGRFGHNAKIAIPKLTPLLNDDHAIVQKAARTALDNIER